MLANVMTHLIRDVRGIAFMTSTSRFPSILSARNHSPNHGQRERVPLCPPTSSGPRHVQRAYSMLLYKLSITAATASDSDICRASTRTYGLLSNAHKFRVNRVPPDSDSWNRIAVPSLSTTLSRVRCRLPPLGNDTKEYVGYWTILRHPIPGTPSPTGEVGGKCRIESTPIDTRLTTRHDFGDCQ
jgi:hypothetical protein